MIPDLTIGDLMIDCADAERARDFYANLFGYKKTVAYDCPAVKADNGMTILFAQPDIPHVPPVWPEEPGEQQKQIHLDFRVRNQRAAERKAIRLGATKSKKQYGDWVTLLDTEGHPFCLCQGDRKTAKSAKLDCINVDCQVQKKLGEFYAQLTSWDRNLYGVGALVLDNGMIVCFQGCDADATMDEYISPVWPEEPGKQQKQMHFNFQVDDLQSAVEEAVRLGATKAAEQYGGEHFVTLIDTEGHPFCLCARK